MQTTPTNPILPTPEQGGRVVVGGTKVLAQLSFNAAPLGGDIFTANEISSAVAHVRDGLVRVIKANVSSSVAVVFGAVEDIEGADGIYGRAEVSVSVSISGDGGLSVDGRSITKQGSERNGERVAALLLAAQAEHGGAAAAERFREFEQAMPRASSVTLSRRDVRAGILNWEGGDGVGEILADMRLARVGGRDPEIGALLRAAGMRLVEELHPFDEIDPSAHGQFVSPAEDPVGQELDWAEFVANHRGAIEGAGASLVAEPSFGLDLVDGGDGQGAFHPGESDDESMDWFGFEYGIDLGQERVNIVPSLVDYLRSRPAGFCLSQLKAKPAGYKIPVKMKGGGPIVAIDAKRLHGVLAILGELLSDARIDEATGHLKVHRLRAAQLANSEGGKAIITSAPDALLRSAVEIDALRPRTPIDVPAGFLAELRPYQQDGFEWLQFLREQELGGILADDMGLGKTIQTLCHLHHEKASGRANLPTLIVAPKSVAPGWESETKKFAPSLTVLRLEGAGRKKYYSILQHVDLVITSYPVLLRDVEELAEQEFHYVVLDEAHTIKNSSAQITKVAYGLNSRHRLALSGTPIENHLGELWSLFHFLMPGFLGSEAGFQQGYRVPIEKMRDEARMAQLAERVRPLMLRRTKTLVAKDLPPKTEIIRRVELSSGQVDLYEAVRASLSRDLNEEIDRRGLQASRMQVLAALMKLRQVCCHPSLLKLSAAKKVKKSAKLELLMELVEPMVEEGRRILVFSQFTGMLSLIEVELKKRGIGYLSLTGASKDRGELCRKFQTGEVPVFLISLRAGGTGITLTAADTVIHYDPWWNPALEAQATDRAYRIGQTNPVFVYKLISRGTIEEKIVMLQQKKRTLFEGLLEGTPQKLEFSESDLENLFAPIAGEN